MNAASLRARAVGIGLLAVAAGAGLGACGGSAAPANPATTTAAALTATTSTSSSTSSPTTTQTTTVTSDGAVTTITYAGTSTLETLPGSGKPTIELADMNTGEQFLLGSLYAQALGAQGYQVDISRNVGTTPIAVAAVMQGSIDIYPEYLDVWNAQIAHASRARSLAAAYALGARYAIRRGLRLLPPTPFSDTSGIAVLSTYAAENHLRSIADLTRVQATLTLGSPAVFTGAPSGLPAVERAYGFLPAAVVPVTIGQQYAPLRDGTADAVYAETSDGQLSEPLYKLLSDPLHVFGFGNVVPVVSRASLIAEGPVFAQTIERVDQLLTPSAMRGLNAEVAIGHHDYVIVARDFLQGNGILPAPTYPVSTGTATSATTTAPASATTSTARNG